MKRLKNITFKFYEVVIIAVSLSIITGFVVSFFMPRISYTGELVSTIDKLKKEYYGQIDEKELTDAAIEGAMNYLNESHSKYLNESEVEVLNKNLDSTYEGIGVIIYKQDKDIVIGTVYDNSPASSAGLKENDIIKKINDTALDENITPADTKEMVKDASKITIVVERDKKELSFEVEVKSLEIPIVVHKEFTGNGKRIGYIYLETFSKQAYNQVKTALEQLEKEGIDGLIFDVRSNSGGYLDSCRDILSLFEKKGSVQFYIEEKKDKDIYYDKTEEERKYPIVVLIDSKTASASEILALSLKENYGAIIVGTKSYGKGTVQKTANLKNNSMIKYTYAKWYSPQGNSIDGIGITPGVEVKLTMKYAIEPTDNNDDQLKKAIDILTKSK